MTYSHHPVTSQPQAPVDSRFPLYGATFGQAVSRSFALIFRFSGQASRSEFWWAMLFFGLLRVAAYLQIAPLAISASMAEEAAGDSIDALFAPMLVPILAFFALNALLFVATLSLGWRRLRDAGIPGGLTFLALVPLGTLVVFIMAALPSKFTPPVPPRQ